jgi:UDP-N-acetylglucosamine--N-acetylmuramyl-(pentapeptide) pyrophosphoryl-undecaprenol N-acetylglucosamine transferase
MRVLVVTGASGGHIFPALSFLITLKDKNGEIDTLLVLPKRSTVSQIIPDDYHVKYLPTSSLTLCFDAKNLIALWLFIKGFFLSLFIILEFRPDIVVGFGSLDSVPIVMLAWLFRIKTLIHEQNVIPGRANRLLVKFSDKIAISFAKTKSYLDIDPRKIVLTGNPIRQELKKLEKKMALDFFGFSDNKFTILVMGGSQGSHSINLAIMGAISVMKYNYRLQVIHICGVKDHDLLYERYRDLSVSVKFKLFTFLKDMQYAYSACDLVVCRAGATTIAELIHFSLPAMIIPYPFAYQHQLCNAMILRNEGCAEVIEEGKLSSDRLRESLDSFIGDDGKIKAMRSNYGEKFRLNASELLAKEALSLD